MSVRSVLLLLVLLLVPAAARGQVVLSGTVRDAETGAALPAAHVVDEATSLGTITNAEGRFELVVPALPALLRVRYIGYQIERVTAEADGPRVFEISLTPVVYQLGEVFVAGEDFAENVMRKVIERKKAWRARLRTSQGRGFTRITLANEARLVLVSEAVFDTYWDRARGTREVIRSRRETSDFYRRLGIEPAGYIANLYDDYVEIQGLRFIGPTHPDALDHYTFSLAARRGLDDEAVYDIYVAPKTGLAATFVGRIAVLDTAYAMLEAELRPARHVVFPPPVRAWEVFYRQQFAQVDAFWLPVDLRLDGTIRVDPGDLGYAPATFGQVSRFSGYEVNGPLPEAPFAQQRRVTVDSASVRKDDLFLLGRFIVPMTPREAEAFEALRFADVTLEQAFPPKGRRGLFAAFEARRHEADGPQFAWPLILGYEPWLRFNRVDGYFTGIGRTFPFREDLAVELRVAQATGLRRVRFLGRGTYRWGRGGTLEGRYARDTAPRNASPLYTMPLASIPALLGQGDYFDYLWTERAAIRLGHAFPLFRFSVEGRLETHESVERAVTHPWPFRATFRANPPVADGRLHTVVASLAVGDGYQPLRTGPLRRAEVRVERGDPGLFGGDFAFTRYQLFFDGHLPTFLRARPRPNALLVRAFAGTSSGTLPPQRLGVLDGSLGPFSAFGAFRSLRGRPYEGTRYLGLFWEHDFTTTPFERLGLRALVDRGTGLRLFGGHGRAWLDADRLAPLPFTPRRADGFHHELGVSLTDIWSTPFRLDLTYRIDAPGFFVGFGLSRLF